MAANETVAVVSDNVNEALLVILNKSIETVDTTVSFLSKEIPDVAVQLLQYHFWSELITFIVCIGVMIYSIYYIKGAIENKCAGKDTDVKTCEIFSTIWGIGGIASFLVSLHSTDWLKIWLAPKLYLIEYVAELGKTLAN